MGQSVRTERKVILLAVFLLRYCHGMQKGHRTTMDYATTELLAREHQRAIREEIAALRKHSPTHASKSRHLLVRWLAARPAEQKSGPASNPQG